MIIIIIKSSKYVKETVPKFAGCNMQFNNLYWLRPWHFVNNALKTDRVSALVTSP